MAADLSVNKVVLLQVSSKLPGDPQGIISREKLKFQFLHINSFFLNQTGRRAGVSCA